MNFPETPRTSIFRSYPEFPGDPVFRGPRNSPETPKCRFGDPHLAGKLGPQITPLCQPSTFALESRSLSQKYLAP